MIPLSQSQHRCTHQFPFQAVLAARQTPLKYRDRYLWGLTDLPADLSITQYGPGVRETIDSIFVPIAGGPHGSAAIQVAVELAHNWDARLTLCTVIAADSSEARRETATTRLERHAADITTVPTTVDITASDEVIPTLAQYSRDHQLIVMGNSEQSFFQRLFTGPVPQRLTEQTDIPIIVAERPE